MKKIYLAFTLIWLCNFLNAQCLTASGGQYPSNTFTPTCSGSAETIATDSYAGEYSLVNVTAGQSYTFGSSAASDFLTISNNGGTTALAFGTTPLVWVSTVSGVVRFYIHTNSTCGEQAADRTRTIRCMLSACSGTPAGGVATAATPTLCAAGTSAISLSSQTAGSGISYQWESSPAGANTFTSVTGGSGATTTNYTSATISTSTDFRCKVTCAAGGAFSYSSIATVSFGSVPANDLVCNAVPLTLNGTPLCANTTCATATGDPAFTQSTPNNTVWYSYTPTTTAQFNFTFTRPTGVTSGLLNGWLGIYTASGTCPSLTLTEVTGNSLSYNLPTQASVTVTTTALTAGTTYYFMVDGVVGAFGQFCIALSPSSAPPSCTINTAPANAATGVAAPVATLAWTNVAAATSYDVYFGTANPPTTLVGNILAPTISSPINGLAFSTQYFWYVVPKTNGISAIGCSSNITSFTTQVAPPPPSNDECISAISLLGGTGVSGTTISATQSQVPEMCATFTATAPIIDVWYKFIAVQNGNATVSVTNASTGFDAVVFVYSGACGTLTNIACADATTAGGVETASLTGLIAGQTYFVRLYSYAANSVGTFTITADGPALPISLTNFKGERRANINLLSWTTATELNNSNFSVERSADGRSYSSIGTVASKATNGNSATPIDYSFNDAKALSGSNYYRLKQTDKDGKFSYSNIVLLKGIKPATMVLSNVYPNPAFNFVNATIESPLSSKVTIVVADAAGKTLTQQKTTLNVGDNVVNVNVAALPAGSYLLKIICDNGCESGIKKFTKQ